MTMPPPSLWYRKRDPRSFVVTPQGPLINLLDSVGDVIHHDDLPEVLKMLGIGYPTAFDLFEPTENPFR